jgi:hypothetical protein
VTAEVESRVGVSLEFDRSSPEAGVRGTIMTFIVLGMWWSTGGQLVANPPGQQAGEGDVLQTHQDCLRAVEERTIIS